MVGCIYFPTGQTNLYLGEPTAMKIASQESKYIIYSPEQHCALVHIFVVLVIVAHLPIGGGELCACRS